MRPPDDRGAEYRIEHREGGTRTLVARGTLPLAPLAAALEARGNGGYLEVIHDETGDLVIRRPLVPAPSAAGT